MKQQQERQKLLQKQQAELKMKKEQQKKEEQKKEREKQEQQRKQREVEAAKMRSEAEKTTPTTTAGAPRRAAAHIPQTAAANDPSAAPRPPLAQQQQQQQQPQRFQQTPQQQQQPAYNQAALLARYPVLRALDVSMRHAPSRSDAAREPPYKPRRPVAQPVPSFPTQPSANFSSESVFEKMDVDTLFFAFYNQQGTKQQAFASRELKKKSWRFHKKYLTWFQRHEEPTATTDEYEQGCYVYFDYESGWCQRIKQDFTFEYSYLEDGEKTKVDK